MLFSEAVTEVSAIVKRPDLVSSVRREINAAISFYCLDNEFPRDFQEQAVALDANEYTQSFALSLLTRFRKFKYLKRGGTIKYLTIVSEAEMFKECLLVDRYYVMGDTVNISLKALAATLDVGYYKYPPILTGGGSTDQHWLLDIAPYMIIDRACSALFRSIGDERSMNVHRAAAGEAYLAFRKDQLSAT
jgi:hypothetical protein